MNECGHWRGYLRVGVLLAWVLAWGYGCVAMADQAYPVTVRDIAGRAVTIAAEPERIYVQNGNHLMLLAILDREDPFRRVRAWYNTLRRSDPSLWGLFTERWPHASAVPERKLDAGATGDLEALLWMDADLFVLDITSQKAVEQGALGPLLERLKVPVLYLDTARDPLTNTVPSLQALGRALNRQSRANAYAQAYEAHRTRLAQALSGASPPLVFLEARAGRLGLNQCCYSQNGTSWSRLLEAANAVNYAASILPGTTGDIPMEQLIARPPDYYLMTGTAQPREGARAIPFGYGRTQQELRASMQALVARTGFAQIDLQGSACVIGISHQFYDNVFNIVGVEYLAVALHPQRMAGISPAHSYRKLVTTFTDLPDRPFEFAMRLNHRTGAPC